MNEAIKRFIKISLWVALLSFALRCFINCSDLANYVNSQKILELTYTLFGYGGEAIGVTSIFMAIFNKHLWRWKPLNQITGKTPILHKKYRGTIIYNLNNSPKKRTVSIYIDQTFLSVSVKLKTAESSSSSLIGAVTTINNEKQLIYTFNNTPNANLQDRSEIHYGTAMLNVDNTAVLSGNYFTGRLTRGSIKLKQSKD